MGAKQTTQEEELILGVIYPRDSLLLLLTNPRNALQRYLLSLPRFPLLKANHVSLRSKPTPFPSAQSQYQYRSQSIDGQRARHQGLATISYQNANRAHRGVATKTIIGDEDYTGMWWAASPQDKSNNRNNHFFLDIPETSGNNHLHLSIAQLRPIIGDDDDR